MWEMMDAFGVNPVPFISTTPRSEIVSRDSVIFGEADVQDPRRRKSVKTPILVTLLKRYRDWGFVNVTEILLEPFESNLKFRDIG